MKIRRILLALLVVAVAFGLIQIVFYKQGRTVAVLDVSVDFCASLYEMKDRVARGSDLRLVGAHGTAMIRRCDPLVDGPSGGSLTITFQSEALDVEQLRKTATEIVEVLVGGNDGAAQPKSRIDSYVSATRLDTSLTILDRSTPGRTLYVSIHRSVLDSRKACIWVVAGCGS